MQLLFIILATIILLGFGAVIFFLNKKFQEFQKLQQKEFQDFQELQQKDRSLLVLNQNIQGMQSRIDKTTEAISQRLDKAAQVISGVSKELGRVQEIGRGIESLQDFLRSPKLRGNIGEQVLRDLLEQYFSRQHFELQHRFREGQIVDAVLKTDKGLIPIDSKFPMENFRSYIRASSEEEKKLSFRGFIRDVKKHIADISQKYILPQEGTVDFAVMYIPSETVYYELIRSETDLHSYAYSRKVFPVSPNSFYYFLKVIMIGLEGKRIEEASKRILATLVAIQEDARRFGQDLGVLTTHITHAKAAIDRVNNEYAKLSGKIDQVRLLK